MEARRGTGEAEGPQSSPEETGETKGRGPGQTQWSPVEARLGTGEAEGLQSSPEETGEIQRRGPGVLAGLELSWS